MVMQGKKPKVVVQQKWRTVPALLAVGVRGVPLLSGTLNSSRVLAYAKPFTTSILISFYNFTLRVAKSNKAKTAF